MMREASKPMRGVRSKDLGLDPVNGREIENKSIDEALMAIDSKKAGDFIDKGFYRAWL
jgi:hypothetical protein